MPVADTGEPGRLGRAHLPLAQTGPHPYPEAQLDGWLCRLRRIVRGGRRLRLRLSARWP
jgi:hypothetical protein